MRFPHPTKLALTALALIFGVAAAAQTITGIVSGPDGVPVAGAKVEIAGDPAHAWTDAWGRYTLSPAPAGSQILRAISSDFEPSTANVTIPAEGSLEVDLSFTEVRRAIAAIEVVGEAEEIIQEIPGAVYLISKDELMLSNPVDANEVLRRVPGVVIREDSGPVGMRLNVGIRGLNPDRSRQVLMLEDGIPISLAPYGEPEMYYSPPIDRMRRVEVLKGSGQIVHGPQTIGGVINFVTPEPPPKTHGDFDLEGGQRGYFSGQARLGGSTRDQSAGWLVNFLHKQGDGFRDLYFDFDDVQSKFTLKPNDSHTFGVKLGIYDEKSNSTYLGLTQPMFDADPNSNAVPDDLLKVRRFSGAISHTATISPQAVWNTAFFAYNTVRNWSRQDFDRADAGRNYLGVAGDPSVPGGAIFLRNSSGNRDRAFNVAGLQSGISWEHELGGIRNKLDAGLRYIHEEMEDKHINGERFNARTGIIRDDEDRFGRAFSGYIQNRFFLGERVIFTPGVRLEHYDYERHILRQRVNGVPSDVDTRRGDGVTKAIPGVGLSVKAAGAVTFFTGVHRGFAPPRVKDAINRSGQSLELDAELSWNYEVGARFQAPRAVRGELTFFRLDFANQIIPGAQSGGATTTLVNGGETLHQGIESSLRVQWDELVGSPLLIYTDVRYTHLGTAKFTRNALYGGNRLPYAPDNTVAFLFGVRQRQGFGFQIDMARIGEQFGDNNQTLLPTADGTIGQLPGYTLWNLTADYTVRRERFEVRPYFTIKNLTDEVYIASRAPEGIQPGMFRQANFGIRFSF